jgi:hypothetical protein
VDFLGILSGDIELYLLIGELAKVSPFSGVDEKGGLPGDRRSSFLGACGAGFGSWDAI